MRLTAQDRDRAGAAIEAAEARTDGEILLIVALNSDTYRDAALQWALLAMLSLFAIVAAFPAFFLERIEHVAGWQYEWTARELLGLLLFALVATFLLARLLLTREKLRLALVPRSTKQRRVRRRAIAFFKVGAEKRTASRTGVLLYLSLAERQAEIVVDEAIHARTSPDCWGVAMSRLIDAVRAGRPGDGIVAAIEAIGDVLAQQLPHTGNDPDEMPNRLIMI